MASSFVVTTAFTANSSGIARAYAVGDRITDPAEAEQLAGSPFVVALAPPPPEPVTEQELQERAAALEAIERVDAKLRSNPAPGEQQQEG